MPINFFVRAQDGIKAIIIVWGMILVLAGLVKISDRFLDLLSRLFGIYVYIKDVDSYLLINHWVRHFK